MARCHEKRFSILYITCWIFCDLLVSQTVLVTVRNICIFQDQLLYVSVMIMLLYCLIASCNYDNKQIIKRQATSRSCGYSYIGLTHTVFILDRFSSQLPVMSLMSLMILQYYTTTGGFCSVTGVVTLQNSRIATTEVPVNTSSSTAESTVCLLI